MVALIIFLVILMASAAFIGWYHSKEVKETKDKIKVGLAFKMYHGDPFKWGWKEVQVVGVHYEYAQVIIHYICRQVRRCIKSRFQLVSLNLSIH